jgi:glutamate-1-semialdehyde 2,1-aminomutase|tara:strand:+ start:4327 stop:5745 length:1419 start_codon:yes stop_codon:yes gene_type:complete
MLAKLLILRARCIFEEQEGILVMSKGEELLAKYEKEVEAIWRRMTPKSRELCERAEKYIPGGALRSHSTGTYPSYGECVDGCYQYDIDGNRYIDLSLGMTSIIGHNHPKVAQAVQEQIPKGLVSFMPELGKDALAEMMCKRVPSVEKVWFTLGGSQSFMWAIRAARAFTGRDKIIRIQGGYNGTYDDAYAVPPGPPGLPKNTLDNILFTHWNDKEGTEKVIRENKGDLAAVLTEGLQTGGTIPPNDGYLTFLREITSKYGIVLIFDEIVNFWLAHGGTGDLYDVKPDMNCYGKGIGGGLPMGLIGGRSDIMKLFSQAEKFRVAAIVAHQGDPMSVAASTACLNILTADEIARINAMGELLANGIRSILKELEIRGQVIGYGNHQSVHLTTADEVVDPVTYSRTANAPGLRDAMALYRRSLINKGVRTLENLMALRVSTPISENEIETALAAMREGFIEIHPILKEVAPHLVA